MMFWCEKEHIQGKAQAKEMRGLGSHLMLLKRQTHCFGLRDLSGAFMVDPLFASAIMLC